MYVYTLLQQAFTNKEVYFAQNYDHSYDIRCKSKLLQYALHKTKLVKIPND